MSDDISIPSPTYRVPRHRGIDPGTRRLALIAAGLGGALVVMVGGWSMIGGGHHGVPVVEPQPGPVRVKPANPGGLQVQGVGNDIFSGGSDTTVDKLAPPPEVPDPQALRAPPPPPPARPVEHAVAQPAKVPAVAPAPVARSASPEVMEHSAVPPAAARTATVEHAAPRPAAPAAVPPDKTAAPVRAAGGSTRVQLAALSTEDAAKAEWRNLNRRIPGLLAGHQPVFSRVEHAGHVFWRVRASGFADPADARAFCQHVRAKGLACTVADF